MIETCSELYSSSYIRCDHLKIILGPFAKSLQAPWMGFVNFERKPFQICELSMISSFPCPGSNKTVSDSSRYHTLQSIPCWLPWTNLDKCPQLNNYNCEGNNRDMQRTLQLELRTMRPSKNYFRTFCKIIESAMNGIFKVSAKTNSNLSNVDDFLIVSPWV